MRLLITGGAGFIGSNLVHYLRRTRPEWTLVNVDDFTYAGNAENLAALKDDPKHILVKANITDRAAIEAVFQEHTPDGVMHLAAESHVDRSILDPGAFVRTNVLGTQILLEAARAFNVKRFLHVSTDEVYGSLGATGFFTETTPLQPNSPYSASKAGSDLLVRAAVHTHGMDAVITRCSNNYGPYQFPEKLIPLMISNAIANKPLPVYGDGMQVRDWLHVEDHCSAITTCFEQGKAGEVYNIGGNNEWPNIEVIKLLLNFLEKPASLIQYVKDRPGHDRRYAIDASKIQRELGWKPSYRFEEGLPKTIQWYLDNSEWVERIRSGAYLEYYKKQYGANL